MVISECRVRQAVSRLTQDEVQRAFNSTSLRNARTAITKFSTALTAELLAQVRPTDGRMTVRAAFKGNKSGQSGGEKGGLSELKNFAKDSITSEGCEFLNEECLLDFMISGSDVLKVLMTVESEARPIAHAKDMHDLDKLLLVGSSRRLYIGRVNITKLGRTHKLEGAKAAIADRLRVARENHRFTEADTFDVVLLETSVDSSRIVHVGSMEDQRLAYQTINLNNEAQQVAHANAGSVRG